MEQLLRRRIGDRVAVAIATESTDGDVHPERVDAASLRRRQIEATGATWMMIDEVHGVDVVAVDAHSPWPLAGSGDVLHAQQTTVSAAVLGPCIHSCCYEFGAGDLDRVAAGVGALPTELTGVTAWGAMALDVPRAVAVGLARRDVALDAVGRCTGCDQRFRSHRRRAEVESHALVAWFEAAS